MRVRTLLRVLEAVVLGQELRVRHVDIVAELLVLVRQDKCLHM